MALPNQPTPRSTVYRARALLVPGFLLDDQQLVDTVNTVLGPRRDQPRADARAGLRRTGACQPGTSLRPWQALPRVAGLNPVRGVSETAHPHVVDAWVALQTLREAAAPQQPEPGQPEVDRDQVPLSKDDIDQFALEHLLISSSINGSGAHGTGGGLVPGAGGDGGGTGADPHRLLHVLQRWRPASRSQSASTRPSAGTARPITADGRWSPCWTPASATTRGWTCRGRQRRGRLHHLPDGFVTVDWTIQDASRPRAEDAARPATGTASADQVPLGRAGQRRPADRRAGHLHRPRPRSSPGSCARSCPTPRSWPSGSCTATASSTRATSCARLGLLADRVANAVRRRHEPRWSTWCRCRSATSASPSGRASHLRLWKVIDELARTGRRGRRGGGELRHEPQVLPGGVRQPPGRGRAGAADQRRRAQPERLARRCSATSGRWVRAWAPGAGMVSTFPASQRQPARRSGPLHPVAAAAAGCRRAALDPDDYRSGFAIWSRHLVLGPAAGGADRQGTARRGARLEPAAQAGRA